MAVQVSEGLNIYIIFIYKNPEGFFKKRYRLPGGLHFTIVAS